jgi:NAD(P)-dependent dehydrogenase (short-subunit alcohol dehydrogenase family)
MLLQDKSAIIYGAGAVGGAVARRFAAEGATVFLAGRTLEPLERLAKDVAAAGGRAELARVDALDAEAVERHAAAVLAQAGRIDISFNAISLGNTQGAGLMETPYEKFALPIVTAMRSHLLTATAAARHMVKAGSGVILAITAQAARKPYVNVGGFGVAGAAIEGLCRQLAVELGPQGVRVVCICSAGSPDTPKVKEVWRKHAQNAGIAADAFERGIADRTMLKRLPMLAEIANVAALMASDFASPMTGTIANATCGEIAD